MTGEYVAPFKFDSAKSDIENMKQVALYTRARIEGGNGLSEWLHSKAKKYNAPEAGVIAADQFTADVVTMIQEYRMKEFELIGFISDDKTFSLTGSSPFANAYKRIDACMRLGGDLEAEQSSVSACQRFVTAENKRLRETNEAGNKRKQLGLLAIRAGHPEGSPEYLAYIEKGMAANRPTAVANKPKGEADTEEFKDHWSEVGEQIANQLRELASKNENDAHVQERAITEKLNRMVQAAIALVASKVA